MRTNQILHFGRSNKFHCMETMWNVLDFHSNSTVCHPSTQERGDSNEFHSVEFMHLKVSSTLIPHFFPQSDSMTFSSIKITL